MPNRILKESICTSDNVDQLTSDAEAYDLGYEHLYELLPDCQHDGCFC